VTTCPQWEEVSAALDGELPADASHTALRHAARCSICRTALDTVVAPAPNVAPTTSMPLFASDNVTAQERRWLTGRWTRWLLLLAAVVIVAEAVPVYIRGDGLDAQTHSARHLAAWQIGFGVGLFVAAWVSRLSHAMLALASSFAVLSATATVINLAAGHNGPLAETVHLIELIAVFLLWRITPPHLRAWRPGRPPSVPARTPTDPAQSVLRLVEMNQPDPTSDQ
jgi:predicted anti-sigma-YlaC factor YlaD